MNGEHHHGYHHGGSGREASRTTPGAALPGHHAAPVESEHSGHDKHAGHSVEMFRRKFWISLALTVPTLLWGHMLARLAGRDAPLLPGGQWIAPLFATAVFLYGGWVFLQGAVRELRARAPGMMTLIALALSVAFVFSAAVSLGYRGCRCGKSSRRSLR